MSTNNDPVELGQLLASTVSAVLATQDLMDQHASARVRAYETAELGTLTLPPMWYSFTDVGIEVELATQVHQTLDPVSGRTQTRLVSRLLDPTAVGLYGYQAASSLKVQVRLAPQGLVPVKTVPSANPAPEPEPAPAPDPDP